MWKYRELKWCSRLRNQWDATKKPEDMVFVALVLVKLQHDARYEGGTLTGEKKGTDIYFFINEALKDLFFEKGRG